MSAPEHSKAKSSLPLHVGIIMDGNGRWAARRGLPRNAGHKKGSKTFEKIVDHAVNTGVKHLTVYTLSTENLEKRPESELDGIMDLLRSYLNDRRRHNNKEVRTKFIGELSALEKDIQVSMKEMEEMTAKNTKMTLNLAVNYGGRREITHAAIALARDVEKGSISLEQVEEEVFSTYLYTKNQPNVDLIIRTGGDMRTSNFLLWQAAYAEFYSTDILWPDFSPREFDKALTEYQKRERRKGGV